jgi:anti-sigma regulatory factor (Ser/Thr protein kinase)
MNQEITITIHQPKDDNLGSSFSVLLNVISSTNKLEPGDEVNFDLHQISFVYPLFALSLSALISHLRQKGIKVKINYGRVCNFYFDTIFFPEGLNAYSNLDWKKLLQKYSNKSYLPICVIPIEGKSEKLRENLLNTFEEIILHQHNLTGQLRTSMSYLISEAITNIVDHAKATEGFVMVQNYPTKEFLDVCIADTGIGILNSYNPEKFPEIITDEQAINNALNGKSTKERPESRGYGISTSRKMLVKGLNGIYFLYSGRAFYVWSKQHEGITVIDETLKWKGTLVALRIPKNIPPEFNYVNFIE